MGRRGGGGGWNIFQTHDQNMLNILYPLYYMQRKRQDRVEDA